MIRLVLFLIFVSIFNPVLAQFSIKGKVTDTQTGDPIPFASVLLKGTSIGISTDFEGNYLIEARSLPDSILVSYLGYFSGVKSLSKEINQVINFQLKPSDFELSTFIFDGGENPAFEIIRKAVGKRKEFDKRSLQAYQTKNYTKIELDIDNISDDFNNRKSVQSVMSVLDSIKQLTNDEGEKILPVFFSETISNFFFRNDPVLRKEVIEKSKVTGIGITDGSTTSQITGSVFQEYNFYKNWQEILQKDFVSPIADGWRTFYDYDLLDTVVVDVDSCYRLQVYPRRAQDLAFSGTIWINSTTYALKQVDLMISKSANLNFVERIKIQQELEPTSAGPLIPSKTRVQIKIGQITSNSAGFLAKFYTTTDSVLVNQQQPTTFFNKAVELNPDFDQYSAGFWKENRADPLDADELAVLQMVDTLKKIPIIRFYSESLIFFATGYQPVGMVDLGPWTNFFNYNDIEGIRLGFGLRSSYKFSKTYLIQGYVGYGLTDKEWKYNASITRIFDRSRWTTVSLTAQKEIDQVGLEVSNLQGNSIFLAASRFGTLRNAYFSTSQKFNFQREFFKGFLFSTGLSIAKFDPLFDFFYRQEQSRTLKSNFQTTEYQVGIRYGRDEIVIINDNIRASLGSLKWPIIELNYAKGMQWLGGDLNYSKLSLYIYQRINLGLLGVGRYELDAGKIFGEVPFPLMKNHLGNETLFYTSAAFNTMNFKEFSSDQYISLRYRQSFEGFLLNSIPMIKKLKWRLVGNANVLWGAVGDQNLLNVPTVDPSGNLLPIFGRLNPQIPFLELGYGIENIFKVFRIDFFHRMNYLNLPDSKPFHLKISAQIII